MITQSHIYREIHPPVSSLIVPTGEQILVHKNITDYITAEMQVLSACRNVFNKTNLLTVLL
jgi:hypothetical protein